MVENDRDTYGYEYSKRTRRQLLATLGVAAGGLTAGCGSSRNNDESDGSGHSGGAQNQTGGGAQNQTSGGGSDDIGKAVEPVFDMYETAASPAEIDVSFISDRTAEDLPYISPAMTRFGTSEFSPEEGHTFYPLLMKSSELSEDGTTWTLTLNEGFTWHDGTAVQIQDYYNYEMYDRLYQEKTSDGFTPEFSEITVVDDYTVEHTLSRPRHPGTFFALAEPYVWFRRSVTQPYLDRMQDATTASEAESIHQEASNERTPLQDFVGHGVFQVDEVNDQEVIFTKYEDHPYAPTQNIERVRTHFVGSDATLRLGWQQDRYDMGSPLRGVQTPDHIEEVEGIRHEGGMFDIRQENKHLQKREVRRALVYLLDFKAAVNNLGFGSPKKYHVGLPDSVAEAWIQDWDTWKDETIQYGVTSKPNEAARSLESAGYSKENGTWVGPDGDPIALNYESNADNPWSPINETYASQMQEFGLQIDHEHRGSGPTLSTDDFGEGGDWDLITKPHGSDELNFAPDCYKNEEQFALVVGDNQHAGNRPWEVTIPNEVGAKEVSGSGQTINLVELQDRMTQPGATNEEIMEMTKTMAHYWNFDIPAFMHMDRNERRLQDTENFIWTNIAGNGTQMNVNGPFFKGPEAGVYGKSE